MKHKSLALMLALVAILTCLMTGCGSNPQPAGNGSTATFSQYSLVLEVTNVCDVRTENKLDDNSTPYEQTIYTCYPGATVSVKNADMSDPEYTEDGNPHAQWALYDTKADTRTQLTDGMEPVAVGENTGVINLESSLCMLVFEFAE